ncbi:class I SAM-dependent methyltransferase [Thiorhodococcus minor]|uniref:Methyltransferase domain-containing protein n=1 Tax=Thiorhodococcus minor TaxID=57489 RepID=A0A6M0JZP5_9GAMM|nr:methyltransferase domain-containing protein [Thiorhodococcus minor]NEV63008.1 methyltransferase domain-containing protein [Thiorhodococcus minor]
MLIGAEAVDTAVELNAYLARFGYGQGLSIQQLWAEMDRVWAEMGLDNRRPLGSQRIADFYAHPVWVLNGLFADTDPTSVRHRQAIAAFLKDACDDQARLRIADYGGGSGALARQIVDRLPGRSQIDLIEPFPSDFFRRRLGYRSEIRFHDVLSSDGYDVVIAQDVLEHVEQPIALAQRCIDATRQGGLVLFANCFYPCIQCHLPGTFYLRHTFRYVLASPALSYVGAVPGAAHVLIFRKHGEIDVAALVRRDRIARGVGPLLNLLGQFHSQMKTLGRRAGLSE